MRTFPCCILVSHHSQVIGKDDGESCIPFCTIFWASRSACGAFVNWISVERLEGNVHLVAVECLWNFVQTVEC